MKLSTKFISFIVIIHLVAVGLSLYIFKKEPLFFIASEVFIMLSLFIAWQLYNEMIQPLNLLMTGVEAIKDRDFNVKFLKTGKYEMDRLIEIYNQMIDQLRTERTRQEEQHFFLEKLIHTSPTGILMMDFDENITAINPKAQAMLSIQADAVLHRALSSIQHPVLQALSHLKTGESRTINFNGLETYKCQKAHFMDRGFPRYFIMLEELTTEILAAEKNAYGKVIRMMAHEVNNSVGAVNSILDTTISLEQNQPDVTEALQVARDRNENLNQFMRRFADVVRLPIPHKEPLNISALVMKTASLMSSVAKRQQIRFEFNFSDDDVTIAADVSQMEQVLINVIKNAIESIENDGTIMFETTHQPLQLLIIDTGKGIQKGIEEQLFSPFFSTKRNGQGVGLTLIREILVNHGFGLSLHTEQEGKTVFRVRF
ncbi:sensor histidine kinase [Runella aurantiaca]|uniref:histidine kinase n=1 Tax=Runella aurantiaca TaxID=2282308 RepID=A0A369IEX4_9BACT|nr:ATP-binding protein [Runella aurantiaca]RDB05176.1 HAMP domain-containing protein [Runella aurantiaca]